MQVINGLQNLTPDEIRLITGYRKLDESSAWHTLRFVEAQAKTDQLDAVKSGKQAGKRRPFALVQGGKA